MVNGAGQKYNIWNEKISTCVAPLCKLQMRQLFAEHSGIPHSATVICKLPSSPKILSRSIHHQAFSRKTKFFSFILNCCRPTCDQEWLSLLLMSQLAWRSYSMGYESDYKVQFYKKWRLKAVTYVKTCVFPPSWTLHNGSALENVQRAGKSCIFAPPSPSNQQTTPTLDKVKTDCRKVQTKASPIRKLQEARSSFRR